MITLFHLGKLVYLFKNIIMFAVHIGTSASSVSLSYCRRFLQNTVVFCNTYVNSAGTAKYLWPATMYGWN